MGLGTSALLPRRRQRASHPDDVHLTCCRYHLLKDRENIVLIPQIESAKDVAETLSHMVSTILLQSARVRFWAKMQF